MWGFQIFSWSLLLFEWADLFLKTYVTPEGTVSYNVLYYQQLSIARYQVCFYANNYQPVFSLGVS